MLNEIKKNFKNAARERLNVRGTIDLLKLMASAFLCTESVAQRLIIYTTFAKTDYLHYLRIVGENSAKLYNYVFLQLRGTLVKAIRVLIKKSVLLM